MPESFGRFKMYQTINCVSDEIDDCDPNKYQDDIDTETACAKLTNVLIITSC